MPHKNCFTIVAVCEDGLNMASVMIRETGAAVYILLV